MTFTTNPGISSARVLCFVDATGVTSTTAGAELDFVYLTPSPGTF
jgi:hypothetical protein